MEQPDIAAVEPVEPRLEAAAEGAGQPEDGGEQPDKRPLDPAAARGVRFAAVVLEVS